jgi:hypothetical protein
MPWKVYWCSLSIVNNFVVIIYQWTVFFLLFLARLYQWIVRCDRGTSHLLENELCCYWYCWNPPPPPELRLLLRVIPRTSCTKTYCHAPPPCTRTTSPSVRKSRTVRQREEDLSRRAQSPCGLFFSFGGLPRRGSSHIFTCACVVRPVKRLRPKSSSCVVRPVKRLRPKSSLEIVMTHLESLWTGIHTLKSSWTKSALYSKYNFKLSSYLPSGKHTEPRKIGSPGELPPPNPKWHPLPVAVENLRHIN